MKKNIVGKLTSRKLWMSLASFVMNLLVFFGCKENTATQVAALIMAGATVIGYVIGEGLADSSTTLESCINELSTTEKNIVRKLTSRKLWMSLASFVMNQLVFFGYTENTATQVAALIMAGATVIGYVIGEGLADSSTTYDVAEALPLIEDNKPEA